jgi:hypothetical protein
MCRRHARVIYRYRPRLDAREDLATEEKNPGELTREDYHFEITGGGDPAADPAEIDWDEDIGTSIRFQDLQAFLVVFLPALRDVESDLRYFRSSPLARLIDAMEMFTLVTRLPEIGFTPQQRIALVHRTVEMQDANQFINLVARNHGIQVRNFRGL